MRTALLLCLLSGTFGLSVLTIPAASAQTAPVFAGSGLLELLPPSGLIGDGTTSSELYFLALGPDGMPLTGLKLKATATTGNVGDMSEAGNGLYRFAYTPAKTESSQQVTITVKGKVGTSNFSNNWSVSVAPPRSRTLTSAANPPFLTLGQDRSATISFNLAGGDRQDLSGVDLKVIASAGTVENLTNLGGGQFSALYTPPTVNYPHLALLTVVDRRDPTQTYGYLVIPLVGRADYPISGTPGARIMLRVGDRDFGPVPTDSAGKAKIPIVVPPGASFGTRKQIMLDGKVVEDQVDLKIPETRRVSLFPTATTLPSDGRIQVPVRALVMTPDGKPDTAATVVFSATAGVIGATKHEGNGVYVATYTPPFGNMAAQATISVSLPDRPSVQADSMIFNLVPARPATVVLTPDPATLPAGAESFKLVATVKGPDGMGLAGRTVTFNANGARLGNAGIKDLKNGEYQGFFSTTGTGPVEIATTVSTPATGNPLARVLLVPGRERVPADGLSSAPLTVVTVDSFGYPVPNVPVTLKVVNGDGSLPQTATTDSNGIAQIYYTAGRTTGMVRVEVSAGGSFLASSALIQAPNEIGLPDLPTSGERSYTDLANEWGASLSTLRIERQVAASAAPPAMTLPPIQAGGAPAKLAITAEPATVSPGGSVTLRIQIQDANGNGVGGQTLDFLTSAGSVGPVSDQGGGLYTTTLSVPPGTSGEIKVSAATRDGSQSAFMRISVGGAETAWGAWGTAPATTAPATAAPATTAPATTTPEPPAWGSSTPTDPNATAATPGSGAATPATVTKPPRTPRTPSDDLERAWLRIRGGYMIAGYTYEQQPLAGNSTLYPQPVNINAVSMGLGAAGRAWLPMFRYVGVEVNGAGTRYTVEPQPFCKNIGRTCEDAAPVGDWVTNFSMLALGRYYFDAGQNTFHIGARLGYAQADVQTYQIINDSLDFPPISMAGMGAGAELGAEIGPDVMVLADFTEYFAGGTDPNNTRAGLEVAYSFLDFLYVSGRFDASFRKVEVLPADGGNKVGEISDSTLGGLLSLGFEL